jgi:hypothetical protein
MKTELKESEKLELKGPTSELKSGFLVIFHRDLAIAKTETPQEDGGINSLLAYIENNPGKKLLILGREPTFPQELRNDILKN